MTKRILSLILAAALLIAVTVPMALAENSNEYYAFTDNGNKVNVRNAPNGMVIAQLAVGAKVTVLANINEYWAMITDPDNPSAIGYVNRRFLISVDPELLLKVMEEENNQSSGDPMTDINAEFACAKEVEPYKIQVRPARVTSWVNMRWIPSETGLIVAKYKATEQLTVLKELDHYLQVQDPDTGDVGYIHKRFAAR